MRLRVLVSLASLPLFSVAACSSTATPAEDVGSTSQAIDSTAILARAKQWVTAELLYCQSANHATDYDPSCSSTCVREDNAAWDPYRSDCSGFISWAWGLPAPGRDTSELAPADTAVSYAIDGADLQPGDALNIPGDHIVLFVSWATVGSVANFYEEPGCSADPPYAHAFTSNVSISGKSVYLDYEGMTFTAIRFTGLTDSGTTPGSFGDAGTSVGDGEATCHSDTLGRDVPGNTCVQSSSDGLWYQCDDGSWVDRESDPAACIAVYPLDAGAGEDAASEAGVDAGTTLDATVDASLDAGSGHTGQSEAGITLDANPGAPGSATKHDAAASVADATSDSTDVGASIGPGSSGCSLSPARGASDGAGGTALLFGLGALGIATTRRRSLRRQPLRFARR
jgi:hypothetical protein